MTKKELKIVSDMIDHWTELNEAIKNKDWSKAHTIKCWLGHDLEDLYNGYVNKTFEIFDSKL